MPSPHLLAVFRTKDATLFILDGNATTVAQTKVLV